MFGIMERLAIRVEMTITIEFNEEKNVIIGRITGMVNRPILRKYTIEMNQFIHQKATKLILSDYRAARFPLSMIEVFNLPDNHSLLLKSLGSNVLSYKRALVFNKKNIEMANFFENVAVNRGHNVKVFLDEDEAFAWLLSS